MLQKLLSSQSINFLNFPEKVATFLSWANETLQTQFSSRVAKSERDTEWASLAIELVGKLGIKLHASFKSSNEPHGNSSILTSWHRVY